MTRVRPLEPAAVFQRCAARRARAKQATLRRQRSSMCAPGKFRAALQAH